MEPLLAVEMKNEAGNGIGNFNNSNTRQQPK
jgi:hypothetical protein